MNMQEIIERLNAAGIYQLYHGESVVDALRSVENGTARVGYECKHRDGRLMDHNEIIAASNKEAFTKMVRTPEYRSYPEVNVETITGEDDQRTDESKIGEIQSCQYCGKPLRVDEGMVYDILNCDDCMSYAILHNCM